MVIAIVKENNFTNERRTPLTPQQVRKLIIKFPNHRFVVEKSNHRCFSDNEYSALNIDVSSDIKNSDIFLGIKGLAVDDIVPGKLYFSFTHLAKKQSGSLKFIKELQSRQITLIDYEFLRDMQGRRLTGFGYLGGIAGAYLTISAIYRHYKEEHIKPLLYIESIRDLYQEISNLNLPPVKILITGNGRVASGTTELLRKAGIRKICSNDFRYKTFSYPVFTQLSRKHYLISKKRRVMSRNKSPYTVSDYKSCLPEYLNLSDVYIACHFWEPATGNYFENKDIHTPGSGIKIISDISCDLPGALPSTIRTSALESPFYGYNPANGKEVAPFQDEMITVMAVDNLPNAFPCEASHSFGEDLIHILEQLLKNKRSEVIQKATIIDKGELTPEFRYLDENV